MEDLHKQWAKDSDTITLYAKCMRFLQSKCAAAKTLAELQEVIIEATSADWIKEEEATFLQASILFRGATAAFTSFAKEGITELQLKRQPVRNLSRKVAEATGPATSQRGNNRTRGNGGGGGRRASADRRNSTTSRQSQRN